MEFRKLIAFGKGSYVITLPKAWIEKNKIDRGSALSLDVEGNSLVISSRLAEKEKESRTIVINADKKSLEKVKTEIIAAYLTNYSTIEIISKNLKKIGEKIKEVVSNLAGMEILEQTSSKITVKYLLDIKEISMESLIRRMDNITRSLISDAIESIDGPNNYFSIDQRDSDVNRLYLLICKTAREIMDSPKIVTLDIWEIHTFMVMAEKLEKIADRQKRISRALQNLTLTSAYKTILTKNYQMMKDSYVYIMKAFYQCDKDIALEIETDSKNRIALCAQMLTTRGYKAKKGVDFDARMQINDIVSNLRAMSTSIKMIARLVLGYDKN